MCEKESMKTCNRLLHLLLLLYQELKATNESLKSLQTQLELAYASTASSGQPVAGGGSGVGLTGVAANIMGLGSVSGSAGADGGTVLGGSVAVPGGVPGSTTLTAIMETKDARITTLEKEVVLLEAELQRIKECGGRLREQLLKAIAVPAAGDSAQQQQQLGIGTQSTGLGGQQQPGTLPLTRGPSMMTSLVPYGGHTSSAALTSSLLTGSTGATGSGLGSLGIGGGSSCLAGISSGATTGVVNPYADRYATDHHPHQLHHHQHHHHHHLQQLQQQQQQMQQHLKQIEPAAAGALALHAHTFNKHDLNFKRQVSFFINNVRIEKNDAV